MTGNEIREKFLQYFERHGHTRVRSSPLLPANDPTLLFTNAGMNQFKDVFLGLEKRDYVRACTSQKCLRAGGKHNDLDEVGKTARHQTFFEMLGNFSFGDYFKEDAIKFAWDLLVNEFKLDPARMWFSVYEGDAEVGPDEDAEKFWEQVGAPRERILRFGRKDNFWQMGETGPCGPCSEVHYYMGPDPGDAENCAANVNGPGDIITELWNLVFMQFVRIEMQELTKAGSFKKGGYQLDPLPKPSVDTGMGLERLAVVLQGVKTNFDTDLLRPIIDFTARLSGHTYEEHTPEAFAMRVVADHARSTAFSIADGIVPGNEGRNYVLRKIMRRAIYHGRLGLWFKEPFFYRVCDLVVDLMHEAFPELEASRDLIQKIVKREEERFGSTLAVGLQELEQLMVACSPLVPAMSALVRLYDTRGIPRDLIRINVEDWHLRARRMHLGGPLPPKPDYFVQLPNGRMSVDVNRFDEEFDAELRKIQQPNPVSHRAGNEKVRPVYQGLLPRGARCKFTGYEETRTEGALVRALVQGDQEVIELKEGDEGEIVLDRTPFYAEAGGQVGDTGVMTTRNGAHITVTDTFSPKSGLIIHRVRIDRGMIRVTPDWDSMPTQQMPRVLEYQYSDVVTAEVDVEKRDATRRNHTATHLVHAALREVLGGHVKQAGSVVAPNYLRFDFTHYQPMTETEVKEVERLVNEQVLRNVKVDTDIMPVEDAIRAGAMALFGEKYSGMMRVLTVSGFSKELCGGTHVRATGDIGVFKITSDESIASGVRRIRAVTGLDAYERFREDEEIIDEVTSSLRTSRAELPAVIGKLQEELKKTRREAEELKLKIATGAASNAATNGDEARDVAGVKVLAREASGLDAAGMRQLSDTLLARIKSGVVIIGRSNDGKASLIVRTSDDLTKRVPAGQVIKELAPLIGGKGGGKPDMAEGGGSQPEKLAEALEASYGVIKKMLS